MKNESDEKISTKDDHVKKSFFNKIKDRLDKWASDDYFIPVFVTGTGSSEEMLGHLSFESNENDVFLADRDSTSLKADILIISGIINYKNLKNVKKEYNNLVGRKYVVVMGNALINTKQLSNYNIVENIGDHIPVDLYIHGQPPSRHEIIAALNRLKDIRK